MNILIPDSWLRDYLETDATPKDIQKCLSLCGPSIERMTKISPPLKLRGGAGEGDTDYIYDVEITTNRVDSMSVYGLAREAVAILPEFGFTAKLKNMSLLKLPKGDIPGFTIHNNPELCKRILALRIENVNPIPSPQWLQDRLVAVGLRPINCLVDITNYVMWETGHPTHVFDFDRLTSKKMVIRLAKKGEHLVTLDEKNHDLLGGEVIIDDGTGTIIDLPSVMGTANSVVVESTTSALLFVDDVISTKVRFASMSHAIRTQAATLLEKDIDPESSLMAMSRMVELLTAIFPKIKLSPLYDTNLVPTPTPKITISLQQITKLVGVAIPISHISAILTRLGFIVKIKKLAITVTPPPWRRNDIQIAEDVIEELARIYGYHNIKPLLMAGNLPTPSYDKTFYWENRIKTTLKYLNFTEVYTYSLVANDTGLKLKNPLTLDWAYLRTALFPSHELVINQNLGRIETLNLFEIANVYLPKNSDLPVEESHLLVSSTLSDYYKFKGIIIALLKDLGITDLQPEIISRNHIFYWEIPMSHILTKVTDITSYTPISKFSPLFEDLNIVLSDTYADLEKRIYALSPLIKNIELIDRYESKLTLRLTYHSDHNQLTSADILLIRDKLNQLTKE